MAGRFAQTGFTYMGVMAAVLLMGAIAGSTAEVWHTAQKREKERELLFIGQQFRLAIERYYLATPGRVRQFPPALEDMLRDPRYPGVRRYLRRLWRDPMTGEAEWGLMRGADGGIQGVYSLSEDVPLKIARFDEGEQGFAEAKNYTDWVFFYRPTGPLGPASPGLPGGEAVD
ncbi:MAG TPA: type II secretion system protein [Chromatiales bacterium]|nr:type II secretion system protein [Chromatiales bacterium]